MAEVDRGTWIAVGMALKHEGYPVGVWDEWSRNDQRYHPGECEKLWEGFHGCDKPVTGGTILQMAKERGWDPRGEDGCFGWDDTICFDGKDEKYDPAAGDGYAVAGNSAEELIRYLEAVLEPGDYVAFVTGDVWKNQDGRWAPGKGQYDRTAAEIIAGLRRHPEDMGATIGDWKEEAGAWIRFNPVDGKGVKNENVTKYRYALVESDTMSIAEQETRYRTAQLPIAAMVYSGGKSLHAIVHIDAEDEREYRMRVAALYEWLRKNGIPIDPQNRNPSRLSRMPGVTRNGKRQRLVAVNIGKKSWNEWREYLRTLNDALPEMVRLADVKDHPPALPEELISGILRMGHKMLISGPSKAGKSFLLMELCIAIAEGIFWLGFQCRKGRVLYINLEIDPASAIDRFLKIYRAMGIPMNHAEDIVIWNLRGHAEPLDRLVPKLIRRIQGEHYDAVVLDPIYKVITGDENSASDMGAFCNQFDKICTAAGCAAIYCHHHSKGAQGMKKAMDRASGSGVFARDPDAQLDIIELEMTEEVQCHAAETKGTAWRLETSLREFPNIVPMEFWFEYPLHRVDKWEELKKLPAQGTFEAGKVKNKCHKTSKDANEEFRYAYELQCIDRKEVPIEEMAEYLGLKPETVRSRAYKLKDEFKICKNCVVRAMPQENQKTMTEEDKEQNQ